MCNSDNPSLSIAFFVSTLNFETTIQLLLAYSLLTGEHYVPPHVQVLLHLLPILVQTGLIAKASRGSLPGSPTRSEINCVQSVPDCLDKEKSPTLSCRACQRICRRFPTVFECFKV